MQLSVNGATRHLTYCTNIHPSKGWDQLFANLQQYVPAIRDQVAPQERFGIGVCFSNQQTLELLSGNNLVLFKQWLSDNNFYVFTLNGFVHGEFHIPHIKDTIYKPDWRSQERVEFAKRLVQIITDLLPDDMQEGSFSSSPLSYKYWPDVDLSSEAFWQEITRHVVQVVDAMASARQATGKHIHMDLEPEPDCVLETSDEVIAFYETWMLAYGAQELAQLRGCSVEEARTLLLDHLQICFDVCHAAVEYEDIGAMLDAYEQAGIRIGKIQVSSALRIPLATDITAREETAQWLNQFAEDNFLHQVVERDAAGEITRYQDLPSALPHLMGSEADEWRIHYHVPVFLQDESTTQNAILDAFAELRRRDYTRFVEVETYTWKVLPSDLRLDLTESISRELKWVLECL